ncbi:DUF6588 family protein [Kordia jejudonensis]|uniref:DUF6588 family protein n=1 Tax=Kordia jejudonensis TaxID=1348245 RepID=UPI000629CEF2|nr:DUF6588 family protein [Kordia jejudonensis]
MKKITTLLTVLLGTFYAHSQDNVNELLAAGIDDAKRFSTDYIAPASEGLAYGINNGWFNSASSPKRYGFEISIVGNASFIKDDKKSFQLNVADYENIRFPDNSPSKTVATALGQNEPDVTVVVTYDDPIFGSQEVTLTLPTGIGSENVDMIPTAYVQASFSPFKGTQLKGRFFPKVDTEDVELSTYGFGIQQEFTSWLPAESTFPVAVSGLIAYTHLNANYDFTNSSVVAGDNQQVETEVNTLLFQLIVGTKFEVVNFYGGLGYISGDSQTDLLGNYTVTDGVFFSQTITDPFTIDQDISGIRGTLGANLKLGFFSLNADYSIGEFDAASLGLNFSF